MGYCHTVTLEGVDFDTAVQRAEEALKREGFGVLVRLDIRETLRQKLDVEFPRYMILGACNPGLAHRALQAEPHIGVMLPCNVVVRACGRDLVEICAIDPLAAMQAADNPALDVIAREVQGRLRAALAAL
jgi:uncharacterized protein (DUF302 family)